MKTTIFMGNLGYLRGINGSLAHHVRYSYRHFYCSRAVQEAALQQLAETIRHQNPNICCFVEIDQGAGHARAFNQLERLASEQYAFFDIENKYGPSSRLRSLALTRGKSNGFLARQKIHYEKIYFTHGTKKLIYKLAITHGITLFFAHFSLKKATRMQQLAQIRNLMQETHGEVILLGDFNILGGFDELLPLLHNSNYVLLNERDTPTFRFHTLRLPLDLCICTKTIAQQAHLTIIPQSYSDHDALVVTISH